MLIEKFPLQKPLHRIGKLFELEGCAVSGGTLKRLPEDWRRRYGYRPVLLETFMLKERFREILCSKNFNLIDH